MSEADATDLWNRYRALTAARIGLARSGASLATAPLLDVRLAHARARDAVHRSLDAPALLEALKPLGRPVVTAASAATDMRTFLLRPDLGRQLAAGEDTRLTPHRGRHDAAIVVTGGLSAQAVQDHAAPVLASLVADLARDSWTLAPLVIVPLGRVALGDAIADVLGAETVLVLIGERPGLSAPDSMGAYLTFRPHAQTTDADRNCVSNIRPDGVGYADAAFRLAYLMRAMRARQLSGVRLKDGSERLPLPGASALAR